WADPTSLQLADQLLGLTEEAAVLLVVTQRPDPDHASWALRELAARRFPHRTRSIDLEALSGSSERELIHALVGSGSLPAHVHASVGAGMLPADVDDFLLDRAEGTLFFLEELVRSLVDAGALHSTSEDGWRYDHDVVIDVPPTVEKVILARVDRLTPACHDTLT